MRKNYYLFNAGRLSRRDNTLKFIAVDKDGVVGKPKYIPVEGINALYVFGNLDANSALFNFLGKKQIPLHFFDFYEHYRGSFLPKEYLLAGKMQVEQVRCYLSKNKRMHIAQAFISSATFNMIKNLKYYQGRGRALNIQIEYLEDLRKSISKTEKIDQLMGLEGNARQCYYTGFELVLKDWEMGDRSKRPPSNEVNALISFGNMMCYSMALDQIYHTQLNPTISYLHEPGTRRFSLALDIAEIFKPILVDRTIFKTLNKKEIQSNHFESKMNGCFLKESGKKIFIRSFEERLRETIKHRKLKRKVSYKHLVKLECYKLSKYILSIDKEYSAFQIWW